jgi:hypothetical protein
LFIGLARARGQRIKSNPLIAFINGFDPVGSLGNSDRNRRTVAKGDRARQMHAWASAQDGVGNAQQADRFQIAEDNRLIDTITHVCFLVRIETISRRSCRLIVVL